MNWLDRGLNRRSLYVNSRQCLIRDTLIDRGEDWEDHEGEGRLQETYKGVDGKVEPTHTNICGIIERVGGYKAHKVNGLEC